jgi:hypothetical protein
VGYGSLLARLLQLRPNLGDRGILGLFSLGFLGCGLHFVVSLSAAVQSVVLAIGMILTSVLWREIWRAFEIRSVEFLLISLFVLLHPQAVQGYDDGLYYLQVFKWNRQFPVVIGLGNLHGRLAYNSVLFLIAPLTDRIQIGWISNCLILVFVSLSLWERFRQTELNDRVGNVQYWFIAGALLISGANSLYFGSSGILSADLFATALDVYCIALSFGFLRSPDKRTVFSLMLAAAMLATAVKVSSLPLLGITIMLALFRREECFKGLARTWLAVSLFLSFWLIHGIMLSGCLVYPVEATHLSAVPWAVSLRQVRDEKIAIQSWARQPGEGHFGRVMMDCSWFPMWFERVKRDRLINLTIVGVLLGGLSLASSGAQIRTPTKSWLTLMISGLAACLMFWFWSAPDVRFGAGFIASIALLGFGVAGAAWVRKPCLYLRATRFVICALVFWGMINLLFLRKGYYIPVTPEAPVYQLSTSIGAHIFMPRTGDQCWAHELPCSPYLAPVEVLRVHWPATLSGLLDQGLLPPQGWAPQMSVYPDTAKTGN